MCEGIRNLNSNLVTEEIIVRGIDSKFSPLAADYGSDPSALARNLCGLF